MKQNDYFFKRWSMNLQILQVSEPTFLSLFNLIFSPTNNLIFSKIETQSAFISQSYYDVKQEVIALSEKIHALKIKSEYIGIHLNNNINIIKLMFAIILAGKSPFLLNPTFSEEITLQLLQDLKCNFLVHDSTFSIENVSCLHFDKLQTLKKKFSTKNVLSGTHLGLCSSGSEGQPSVVVFHEKAIFNQVATMLKELFENHKWAPQTYKNEINVLLFLPMYHVFGLFAQFMVFSLLWATFIVPSGNDGEAILKAIRKYKVSHLLGVPLLFHSLYDQIQKYLDTLPIKLRSRFILKLENSKTLQEKNPEKGVKKAHKKTFKKLNELLFSDSMKMMICGGAPLRQEVLQFFNTIGYPLGNGYGSTECGIASVCYDSSFLKRTDLNVGSGWSNFSFTLGKKNELLIKTENSAEFVIRNGKRSKISNPYKTGDIAKISEDGTLFILGRLDDVFVSENGENVIPDAVEKELKLKFVDDFSILPYKKKNGASCLL